MNDAIVIEVVYPQPIEQVWQALTNREALAEWLMPNDFEPTVGRPFTFQDKPRLGWDGKVECKVVEITAPNRLAFTWRGTGFGLPETLVTFSLEAVAEGTRLRLEHSGFAGTGPQGWLMRTLLASGWGSGLLRQRLPALLNKRMSQFTNPTR